MMTTVVLMVSLISGGVILTNDKSHRQQEALEALQVNHVENEVMMAKRALTLSGYVGDIQVALIDNQLQVIESMVLDEADLMGVHVMSQEGDRVLSIGQVNLTSNEIQTIQQTFLGQDILTLRTEKDQLLILKALNRQGQKLVIHLDKAELFDGFSDTSFVFGPSGKGIFDSGLSEGDKLARLKVMDEWGRVAQSQGATYYQDKMTFFSETWIISYAVALDKGEARLFQVLVISGLVFVNLLALVANFQILHYLRGRVLLLVTTDTYREGVFQHLDKKLLEAIKWIEEVVLHYDELNLLKEELLALHEDLPQERDYDDQKTLVQKIKNFKGKK
jgi:hypothetical protein